MNRSNCIAQHASELYSRSEAPFAHHQSGRRRSKTQCVIFGALFVLCASASLKAQSFPNTTQGIHLGLATDSKISNASVLAGKVDYIWGASEGLALPAGIYADGYLTYDRDDSNKSISWFQSNEPSWIVYNCSRAVAYEMGNPNVPIDITNPAVRSYQLQEAANTFQAHSAYSGIGWDNVFTYNWVPRCGIYDGSTWKQLYSGVEIDTAFMNSVISWAPICIRLTIVSSPEKA
jgi:hypothetical protein